MKQKEALEIVAMIEARDAQELDEFIVDCGQVPSDSIRLVADAIRKSLAYIAPFDHDKLRSSDSYPGSLEVLPGWDSLDFLEWQFLFEECLGQTVPTDTFAKIGPAFTIAELVVSGCSISLQ